MAFKFSSVKPAAKPSPNACEVTNDVQVPDGPPDTVSALAWSPTADFLAVSSWDNSVRVYEVGNPIQGRASYSHEGPALDVCWSGDGTKILSGGADNAGRMFDVQTGQSTQVAQHQAPIKSVRWTDMHGGLLVTGSWDKTIKFWDTRTPTPIGSIDLPDKVFAMDLAQNLLVIASGGYKICLVDLNKPTMLSGAPIDSPLKFQTRCVAVTPTASGYTVGGVEGRVAVQWTNPNPTPGNYSFRCHRAPEPLINDKNTKESQIFTVNTMATHPVHGSCLTGGADGTFSIWDIINKRLLKSHELKPAGSTTPIPVVASAFNKINGGNILAYAVGYDWSHGYKGNTPNQPNRIMLHSIKEEEVKPRPKV